MKGLIYGVVIGSMLWAVILGIVFAEETFIKVDLPPSLNHWTTWLSSVQTGYMQKSLGL